MRLIRRDHGRRRRIAAAAVAVTLAVVAQGAVPRPATATSIVNVSQINEAMSHVFQTIRLSMPALTKLTYGFCNAQICGRSENLECVGNLYIPKFLNDVVRKVSVTAPSPDSSLESIRIAVGRLAPKPVGTTSPGRSGGGGFVGAIGRGIATTIERLPDHDAPAVTTKFPFSQLAPALRSTSGLSEEAAEAEIACGIDEAQKDDVSENHPDGIENPTAQIQMDLIWKLGQQAQQMIQSGEPIRQAVIVNGGNTTFTNARGGGWFTPSSTAEATWSGAGGSDGGPYGAIGAAITNMLQSAGLEPVSSAEATELAESIGQAAAGIDFTAFGNSIARFFESTSGSEESMVDTRAIELIAHRTALSAAQAQEQVTFVAGQSTLSELAGSFALGHTVPSVTDKLRDRTITGVGALIAWPALGELKAGIVAVVDYDTESDTFTVINSVGEETAVQYGAMAALMQHRGEILQVAVVSG